MVPFFLDNHKKIAVALRHMPKKTGPDAIHDRCIRAGRALDAASVALMALTGAAGCVTDNPASLRQVIVEMKAHGRTAASAVRTGWALMEEASDLARQSGNTGRHK